MRIAIYAPYLDVYGGGEKYIGKIAETLSEKHDVEFVVLTKPNMEELQSRLNIDLTRVGIRHLRVPSVLNKTPNLKSFAAYPLISRLTKSYDIFINQEHFSAIPTFAKRSILICEVPLKMSSSPFRLVTNLHRYLLLDPKLRSYDKIVTNSYYSQKWIKKYYNKTVDVLYPPIDTVAFVAQATSKQHVILSVGRFFIGGHSKKQKEMIRFFKELYHGNETLRDWEYHLIGQAKFDAESQEYLKTCQHEAKGYPIFFHTNAPFDQVKQLYKQAKIFWHATGLDEDENKHPERLEHFGIATGEAMSAGCVPIVINKGGQREIVLGGIEGFLWDTPEQLKECTLILVKNDNLRQQMSLLSIKKSRDFDLESFKKRLKQILALEE